MKKIIVTLIVLTTFNSFAKVDLNDSKINLFSIMTPQNIANIKVGGVVFIGATSLKGIMDLKRGTSHWHEINNNIRTMSADKLSGQLALLETDEDKAKFTKRYQTNLKRLDRREKFDDMWFGFSRTLMVLAPLGFAYWLKS